MKHLKRVLALFLTGVILISLSGCIISIKMPHVYFNSTGFKTGRTWYFPGEKVTVYYDIIATDTDYSFSIDEDVELEQDYSERRGYILTFTMPNHDVMLSVESHDSMMYIPSLYILASNDSAAADIWILPQTEENLNTTLWGPVTLHLDEGEQEGFSLTGAYDGDVFFIRIIDEDSAFYSVNDVVLHDGDHIHFAHDPGGSKFDSYIEIIDDNDNVVSTYRDIFEGVLGGG